MSSKLFRNQKLSPDQVQEARDLLAIGVPCTVIARKFSVGHGAIHAIKQGRSWQSLPNTATLANN